MLQLRAGTPSGPRRHRRRPARRSRLARILVAAGLIAATVAIAAEPAAGL
jgi:hypothetical protein